MSEILDRIRASLVGLRMPRALEALDHTVRRLERGEITAIEAIDGLLAEEHVTRESRRVTVAVKTARLMPIKTLESFDFSFQPVRAGKRVYRATLAEIIDALSRAERDGRLPEKLRFFSRNSLLIVDEIGYLPITPGGANLFFQLVNHRYEKGAMILTSNRGFAEWGEVFGDPVVATALLDRLLHHAIVVHIEGASYRLRAHADLMPEHTRAHATIMPPPQPKRRGRPPKNGRIDQVHG